jgi:hypothetical protein
MLEAVLAYEADTAFKTYDAVVANEALVELEAYDAEVTLPP